MGVSSRQRVLVVDYSSYLDKLLAISHLYYIMESLPFHEIYHGVVFRFILWGGQSKTFSLASFFSCFKIIRYRDVHVVQERTCRHMLQS